MDGQQLSACENNGCLESEKLLLHRQGAEARIWFSTFLGKPSVVKQRFKKKYRHPVLDARLTSQRLRQEVRCMLKARKLGVPTPVVYHVEMHASSVVMERIQGETLKQTLQRIHGAEKQPLDDVKRYEERLMEKLGKYIAWLHDGGVIHGDLTSSNVLVVDGDEKEAGNLLIIDFGLSFLSQVSEDRAVDLYVLERAFLSAHASRGIALFEAFVESYRSHSRNWCSTLNRLAEVRLRGRKRSMVG